MTDDGGEVSTLPEMEWEDASHRVRLPESLRILMQVPETEMRWARGKRQEVLNVHAEDASVIHELGVHLANWRFFGRERGSPFSWRVLFFADGRWYATTIARDDGGSLNVVTTFGAENSASCATGWQDW